ncbi:MAG: hypothetical protein NTW73_00890 [Candidatus Parcubacteria bacterium]|nr:hypothetical protein [Candidatus Parcubacteria bacterium]
MTKSYLCVIVIDKNFKKEKEMKSWAWLLLGLPIAGLVILIGWLWVPAIILTGKVIFLVEIIFAMIVVIAKMILKRDQSQWERLAYGLYLVLCIAGVGVCIVAVSYVLYVVAFVGYAIAGVMLIWAIMRLIR